MLDVLELPRVGLVGHDWGGWTGFLACLRAPERFRAFLALGIVHPFQRPSLGKALQGWRMAYQVPLSTPLVGQSLMRAGLASRLVQMGSRRDVGDVSTYGEVFREPARARATVQLYRTFLLAESPQVIAGRYAHARLTVPTRLVNGDSDLVSSRAMLDGFQANAADMSVEILDGVGHFVPEEAPEAVADRARALFG